LYKVIEGRDEKTLEKIAVLQTLQPEKDGRKLIFSL